MKIFRSLKVLLALCVCLSLVFIATVRAVTLEQIISREHPAFSCRGARITVGRNGVVYLVNTAIGDSFLMRINPDGSNKVGATLESAAQNATANADGFIASVHAHFGRKIVIYNPNLEKVAEVGDFLGNDTVGWDAPAHVEAGESGDFYVLDQHRDRIVRINPTGKVIQAYALPAPPPKTAGAQDFRVSEKNEAFYLIGNQGPVTCIGFDGSTKWVTKTVAVSGNTYEGINGGFDVADGLLYAIDARGDVVQVIGPDGAKQKDITLAMGDLKAGLADAPIKGMRIAGKEILIKRAHPTELFQRYELEAGKLIGVVTSDHERLAVTFDSDSWTSGAAMPFKIDFDARGRTISPQWRVWARPMGTIDYTQLQLADGKLTIPADFAGIYQVKVTPEVLPWQRGNASEYRVETAVEIRKPGSKGVVAVFTPENRTAFARGEDIPVNILVRVPQGTAFPATTLRLVQNDQTIAQQEFAPDASGKAQIQIPATLSAQLAPGRYSLTVDATDFTSVAQSIVIGQRLVTDRSFFNVQYGDYGSFFPQTKDFDAPDLAAAHVDRTNKLGFNLTVDRLGDPNQNSARVWYNGAFASLADLKKRLDADPAAVPVDKTAMATPFGQILAGYGASGIQEMSILMRNDAGLPIDGGFPYDGRKPEEIIAQLKSVSEWVKPYRAFRGWTWSSNWWVNPRGGDAATSPEQKAAYNAALKAAKETGKWDKVLDDVSAIRLNYAVSAQKLFNDTMKPLLPDAVTATAAPFRQVDSYPPATFSNVDESDLQAQWEQIGVPYHAALNVDYYKRPGKKAWAHPEIWNDDGTGGQILTTYFQMAMRDADGVGQSGAVPNWGQAGIQDDPRTGYNGIPSVYRAINDLFKQYGPWLSTLEKADQVAIIADGRMLRTDEWHGVMGLHYARLYEAYISCLHAHQPASFVFPEDLKPDGLNRYKAVLIVGQRVELEPELLQAINNAKTTGTTIFYDGTCREELVKDFKPLGLSFDKVEKDPNPAGDDSAYWRFRDYALANAPKIAEALNAVAPPFATTENPEIFFTQYTSGEDRFIWVVNDTTPDLDPGHLWRMNLALTSRVPVVADVKLTGLEGKTVYDVFACKKVEPKDGVVQADLRDMPARLYAILTSPNPHAMQSTTLRDGEIEWKVGDGELEPERWIGAPVHVRFLSGKDELLSELWTGSRPGEPASGLYPIQLNGPLTIEATHLFTGVGIKGVVNFNPIQLPVSFQNSPVRQTLSTEWHPIAAPPVAPETLFGPHVRDLTVTANGKLAVLNTFNWDHNLYAVDLDTGHTSWRQRVGDYFAFSPIAMGDGIAAQGFDFRSAEGYSLFVLGADGKPQRRFALYGLPKRLPHRFVPAIIGDHINNFASPPDGSWIASAGDLGLVVWSSDGKQLWTQDWWKSQRHEARLAVLDNKTLLVAEGMKVTTYDATTGQQKWQIPLAAAGEVRKIRATSDGATCAILSTTEGGRIYILRDGKIALTIPTGGDDLNLSAEGATLAVVESNLLKLYSLERGFQWNLSGDDTLHSPKFSPDGKSVVAGSNLGTLYVVNVADGTVKLQRDVNALPVPAWLDNGDLIVATWMGKVMRLNAADFGVRWEIRLQPEATDMRGKLLAADDSTPISRVESWRLAQVEPPDISKNLLTQTNALIRLIPSGGWGGVAQLMHEPQVLFDGKTDSPAEPWIEWNKVGFFAETSPFNFLLIDTFHTQLKVNSITLYEDPKHPESWLRDAALEYWDPVTDTWKLAGNMLSDAAVHTHTFDKPVEASRLRIVLPRGAVGNLRLGEITLTGELAGNADSDVREKKPMATLFDEDVDIAPYSFVKSGDTVVNAQSAFKLGDSYAGGHSIALPENGSLSATFSKPFGHEFPGWDFPVAEKPEPGQYRYLQIAWKGSPGSKSVVLRLNAVGETGTGGASATVYAGDAPADAGGKSKKVADAVPTEWTTATVDLFELFGANVRIRGMALSNAGPGAAFDQIVIGRTKNDLPKK